MLPDGSYPVRVHIAAMRFYSGSAYAEGISKPGISSTHKEGRCVQHQPPGPSLDYALSRPVAPPEVADDIRFVDISTLHNQVSPT